MMLPDGLGLDLLRLIRARQGTTIVAVLSAAPDELLARAAELEPNAVFRKPINPDAPVMTTFIALGAPSSTSAPRA